MFVWLWPLEYVFLGQSCSFKMFTPSHKSNVPCARSISFFTLETFRIPTPPCSPYPEDLYFLPSGKWNFYLTDAMKFNADFVAQVDRINNFVASYVTSVKGRNAGSGERWVGCLSSVQPATQISPFPFLCVVVVCTRKCRWLKIHSKLNWLPQTFEKVILTCATNLWILSR